MKTAPLLLALALLASVPSQARQAAPAAAPAPREVEPGQLLAAAQQVVRLVDAGRAGEVWDGASAVAQRSIARAAFEQRLRAQRQPLGAISSRRWTSVSRHSTAGGAQLPAGVYANVEFDSAFAGGRSGHELVSFRLDEDGTWRVAGYVLQ